MTDFARSELDMFLDLPDQSEAINQQNSLRSVDWWPQNGLGGPGTCLTWSKIGQIDLEARQLLRMTVLKYGIFRPQRRFYAELEQFLGFLGLFWHVPGPLRPI